MTPPPSLGPRPPWCDAASWDAASAEFARVVQKLRDDNPDAPEDWLMRKEQAAADMARGYAARLTGEAAP